MKEKNLSVTSKCVLAAVSCLAFAACNSTISGTMTVNQGATLQLKDKSGRVVTMSQGNANVVMGSGKIQIKATDSVAKNDVIEVDAPKNMLPAFQTSGSHMFLAKDTGQPVNINEVTIDSDSQSAEHDGWELCTTAVTVEVPCPPPAPVNPPHQDPAKPDANQPPQQNADKPDHDKHASLTRHHKNRKIADACTGVVVKQGHQHIRFHFDGDNFEIQLIMTDPDSGAQLATFDGYSYSSDRVVDEYGQCNLGD